MTPQSPWAQIMHAKARARLGELAQALDEAQALHHAHPRSLSVTLALVGREIDAHALEAAEKTLEQALARHPSQPVVLTRLSYVKIQRGDVAGALDFAQRAVAAIGAGRGDSLAGHAHVNLAHALARQGRREEAYAALRQAVALGIDRDDLDLLEGDPALESFLADPRNPLHR